MRSHKLILPFVILILGSSTMGTRAQEKPLGGGISFRQFSDSFIGRYKANSHEQVLKLGNGWVKMKFRAHRE